MRENRGRDELAEAGKTGREVGTVEKIESVRGGVEGLQNGEIFVGVRVFGFAQKGKKGVEKLRWREKGSGTAG